MQGRGGDVFSRFGKAKQFLQDILLELPASSVEVEKAHANLQHDIHTYCSNAKTPRIIQRDSYIMSAVLAHQSFKESVEKTCLGKAKGKIGRLLRERTEERAELLLSLGKPKTSRKSAKNSLLKGLLSAGLKLHDIIVFSLCQFDYIRFVMICVSP